MSLIDRLTERSVLDQLVAAVRGGESQVLVLLGEAGMGKTALLDDLSERATECRVARVSGVQSEMELAFAGVHQLCAPMLDHLEALPPPQRDALRTAFGISPGLPPDQFLISLAVLGLLSEAAGQQPLICLVDDHQWLDRASARTLGFVARRLGADPVAMVFAARVPGEELTGLPELVVGGLQEADARALLESVLVGSLDSRVKELIVTETRGNPLALLELPQGLTPEQLAGGFGLLSAAPLESRIDAAAELLAMAETGPLDELARARISLVRGRIAFNAGDSSDTPRMLLDAAKRFESLDGRLARETYLEALCAALLGHRSGEVGTLEIARAARDARAAPGDGRPPDLLLDGMATLIIDGYTAGAPAVRQALRLFRDDDPSEAEQLRWLFVATCCAIDVWDDEGWRDLAIRQVEVARELGALSLLPFAITQLWGWHLHAGEFATAVSLVHEFSVIQEATANGLPDFGPMMIAAWQGHYREALGLIDETVSAMKERGEGYGVSLPHYMASVLYNGLGQYQDALASAELASVQRGDLGFANLALVELVEAAVRSGQPERATAALEQLARLTRPSGTAWGLGVEARSRALLSEGDEAERLYREAIGCLGSAPAGAELARAHLVYGEWLRREKRRGAAREQLRIAGEMLEGAGMAAFAERARRELRASGENPRKRTITAMDEELTAQEAQIARLARDGLSNPEIGTRLFISARTVQYHLSRVFTKLGISSRGQLHVALPSDADPVTSG